MADKNPIRVLITLDDKQNLGSGPTLRFIASVVEINEEGKLRNPQFSNWTRGNGDYADLQLNGHASRDFMPETFIRAGEPEYREVFSAGAQRCDIMAKTLKRIAKKLAAQSVQFGDPRDLIEEVIRFATAIGADGFVWRSSENRVWDYDGNEWKFADANTMRYHVEKEFGEWQVRIGVKEVKGA